QEIKGKADAESTRIYAESFGRDPEFYSFLQTLEIYKDTMDKESSLVLSTDSDFLRFFKGYDTKR
ncbi:MAG: protease modulator HflC, partial [Desulfobacteraceae bacterium]